MSLLFALVSVTFFYSRVSFGSDKVYPEEPLTQIEYQPLEAAQTNGTSQTSQIEVSTSPLPTEPEHPQVVKPEELAAITASQNQTRTNAAVPAVVVPPKVIPPAQPVSGNSTESIEPEPPALNPSPVPPSAASTTIYTSVCRKVLDIGILLDSSYTVSASLWETEKAIAATLIDQLDVHPRGTHISIMAYSTNTTLFIPFNGYTDKDDLRRKLSELTYHPGWSRTDLGLVSVKKQMFTKDFGARDISGVPRALVLLSDGRTDGYPPNQHDSPSQQVTRAAEDLKNADITILCVQLGDSKSQELENIASDTTLYFEESDIEGLKGNLIDISNEVCIKESLPSSLPEPTPSRVPEPNPKTPLVVGQLPQPVAAPIPPHVPIVLPHSAPSPVPLPSLPPQCPIVGCTFPLICITAEFPICVEPTSSTSSVSSCFTPGPCSTTVTLTETATGTTTMTDTQTDISTAVATVTSTETETSTSTAVTTHTRTETDVVTSRATDTSTSTLTTTDTQVATSTHHQTYTSTDVVTETATTTHVATKTSTVLATSTAVVTATNTSTHTLTTTKTDTVTGTTTLTTTNTQIVTSTLHTNATQKNTVNSTQVATETLTKTLTTIATDTLTTTYNATNFVNVTATATTTATTTATLTGTTTAKTTETLTATATATLTETHTNTQNTTMTHTKTLTEVSTSVVTTCSANCTKLEPTPSPSITPVITSTTPSPGQGDCAIKYTKLGCFEDKRKDRLLPHLLFTDRDSSSKIYSKVPLDWNNWDTYLIDLACRCAKAAKAKRYTFFSLQYYGECWSGPDAGETYHLAGPSDKCITYNYSSCDPSNKRVCVGLQNVNFVYGIGVPVPPVTAPPRPVPTTTVPPSVSCNKALDLGIIIDSSDSIDLEDYKLCLQFVADLVKRFKVSQAGTHVGAIVYSTTPELQFNFADSNYYKGSRLRTQIKKFRYLGEGTRTDLALSLANSELYSSQGGDRKNKRNLLMVITDGRTHPELSQPYSEVLGPLKEKNVEIIALGVGADVNEYELNEIALNNPSHVFTVGQYKDLGKILSNLLEQSCLAGGEIQPTPSPAVTPVPVDEKCQVDFIKTGCFNDFLQPRPLPELLFTDIDNTSSSFSHFPVDWGSWNDYLRDLVCRCAQLTKTKGYSKFGIENFGECWSGVKADKTYNKDGSSEYCITKEFAQCTQQDKNVCCGNKTTIFVYGLTEHFVNRKCHTQFVNVGCFADNHRNPRPLPNLLFTDMDNSSLKYSGKEAHLGELDTYMWDVVCRCAELARESEFEYFGIQNHGECYSGADAGSTYNKDGASEYCVGRDFNTCPPYDPARGGVREECVGIIGTNYVYRVTG